MSIDRVFIGLLKSLRRKCKKVLLLILVLTCVFIIVQDGKKLFCLLPTLNQDLIAHTSMHSRLKLSPKIIKKKKKKKDKWLLDILDL